MMWSGGSPRGYLPDNFRAFGRLVLHDVPVIGTFPIAVGVLIVFIMLAWWGLHVTVFGRRIFAVGDNPRAAELAGVRVSATRVAAFAILAALKILKGEPVIGPTWKLPQPDITEATLANYVDPKMPPLHYAMCGCKDLPGYPQRWGGKP